MSLPFDPRLLETLRTVVQTGSVSAAARVLHRTQPAITAQLQQLESQVGTALLLRTARGVIPTDAGQKLMPYAEKLAQLLEEARGQLVEGPTKGGQLLIGASTTIASYLLPRLLAEFLRDEGDHTIRIDVANTDEIVERVNGGELPLGLVEGLERVPRTRLERFLPDELVAVVASGPTVSATDFAQVRRATDLLHVPLVMREPGSGTRAVVEQALKKAIGKRPPGPRDLQVRSNDAVKALVVAGLGVGFLSRWGIAHELRFGTLRVLELKDLKVSRHFSWVLPAAEVSGTAGRFLRKSRLLASRLHPQ